jgi:hypothetical protein
MNASAVPSAGRTELIRTERYNAHADFDFMLQKQNYKMTGSITPNNICRAEICFSP